MVLKSHVPVRLLKNAFRDRIEEMERTGKSSTGLATELGKGRARAGMLAGDLDEGELEIGQVSGLIDDMPPVADIMTRLLDDYYATITRPISD